MVTFVYSWSTGKWGTKRGTNKDVLISAVLSDHNDFKCSYAQFEYWHAYSPGIARCPYIQYAPLPLPGASFYCSLLPSRSILAFVMFFSNPIRTALLAGASICFAAPSEKIPITCRYQLDNDSMRLIREYWRIWKRLKVFLHRRHITLAVLLEERVGLTHTHYPPEFMAPPYLVRTGNIIHQRRLLRASKGYWDLPQVQCGELWSVLASDWTPGQSDYSHGTCSLC